MTRSFFEVIDRHFSEFSLFRGILLVFFFWFYHGAFKIIVFLDVGIEPILNFVFRPSSQFFTNFRPPASNLQVVFQDHFIFFICPFLSFYMGVEFIDKSFSNLLSGFSPDHLWKQLPIFPHFLYQTYYSLIFLRGPNLFMGSELRESPITVQTLILIPIVHHISNYTPLFGMLII